MRKVYDPDKMRKEVEAQIEEKRKQQKRGVKSTTVKVTDPKTQVDCVTGATITSNGVADMLKAEKGGLQPYVKFFNAK